MTSRQTRNAAGPINFPTWAGLSGPMHAYEPGVPNDRADLFLWTLRAIDSRHVFPFFFDGPDTPPSTARAPFLVPREFP